jgi:hypothetical protein
VIATSVHEASSAASRRSWAAVRWPVSRSKIQTWPERGSSSSFIAQTQSLRRTTSTSIPSVHQVPGALSTKSTDSAPVVASSWFTEPSKRLPKKKVPVSGS